MEAFVLSSIFLTGLIISGGFHFCKSDEEINNDTNNSSNNDSNLSDSNQHYYEKFMSKNNWNDFLDFSGGTLGI